MTGVIKQHVMRPAEAASLCSPAQRTPWVALFAGWARHCCVLHDDSCCCCRCCVTQSACCPAIAASASLPTALSKAQAGDPQAPMSPHAHPAIYRFTQKTRLRCCLELAAQLLLPVCAQSTMQDLIVPVWGSLLQILHGCQPCFCNDASFP